MANLTRILKPNQRISVSLPAGGTLKQITSVALKPGDVLTITAEQVAAPPPPPPPSSGPIRAAFYYPWFPETWTVNGAHVKDHPLLGYYSSDTQAVVDAHIRALDYAKVKVVICSWWGPGEHKEATRIRMILDRIVALGSPLRVAFYYEKEGFGHPAAGTISSDLAYLQSNYGVHPALYRHQSKPLTVFVYNADDASAEVCARWATANAIGAYVNLKVFPGYATVSPQPGGWHQYAPAGAVQDVGDAYSISAGFWRADEPTARLPRDINRWKQNVRDMVASTKAWHLITSFNEWGEGQSVEAATEWASPSGFGLYLDALATNGA